MHSSLDIYFNPIQTDSQQTTFQGRLQREERIVNEINFIQKMLFKLSSHYQSIFNAFAHVIALQHNCLLSAQELFAYNSHTLPESEHP